MKRGSAKTSFSLCFCLLFVFAQLPSTGWCEGSGLDKYDKPIEQQQSNLEKVEHGVQLHLGELLVISEKEFSLLSQIEKLDKNLRLQYPWAYSG